MVLDGLPEVVREYLRAFESGDVSGLAHCMIAMLITSGSATMMIRRPRRR
jgi:hypothetical protein